MPRFFKAMERNSPYQTRMTWKIPRSSDAEYFKYRFSSLKKKNALNTKIRSIVYRRYASFLKSRTIKQPISSLPWKIPRSSSAEYIKSCCLKKNTLNPEIWSTVYGKYASFWKPWRKTAHKQKYEIAQCQLPEITLSNYVCIFLHSFYFTDNRYVE